jgi:carbon starvation protein
VWPLFGTTNQLLAALVLLVIYLWVKKQSFKNKIIILVPTFFMLITTISSLGFTLYAKVVKGIIDIIVFIGMILFLLCLFIIVESAKCVLGKEKIL